MCSKVDAEMSDEERPRDVGEGRKSSGALTAVGGTSQNGHAQICRRRALSAADRTPWLARGFVGRSTRDEKTLMALKVAYS